MRFKFFVAAALLSACPASADPRALDSLTVSIGEAGVFGAELVSRSIVETTASGAMNNISRVELLERTDKVCARLGLVFGFHFSLTGGDPRKTYMLDWVTHFPAPGLTNPATNKVFQNHSLQMPARVAGQDLRAFTFDEAWEIQPGRWTFEFHHKGRKIGEKSFDVASECGVS